MIIPETPSNCTGIFTRERKIQPGTLHNAVKAQKAKKRFFCSDNTSTARKGKDATLLTGCDRYPAGCGLPARCKSKRRQAGRGEPPPPPPPPAARDFAASSRASLRARSRLTSCGGTTGAPGRRRPAAGRTPHPRGTGLPPARRHPPQAQRAAPAVAPAPKAHRGRMSS